jgi:serine/threonine-protein kinase
MPKPSAPVRFLSEIRRRRVGRVVVAYAAAGWILAEISSVVFPALQLPDWTITLVVVLLLLGFPVAVVLAWAFDLTPEGVHRTLPLDPGAAIPTAPTNHVGQMPVPAHTAADRGGEAEDSVAVVPFANLARDPAFDPFVDGLTEELITGLAHVHGLRVSARTSAFALKDKGLDAREIGQRLKVDRLVEGSVRIDEDRMRLTVHLVDTDHGATLWSETYNSELGDLFAVQDEIARSIVDRLRPEVAARMVRERARNATEAVDAYAEYLRGRYHWNRRTEEGLREAIRHFDRAIELDPVYAVAHAGLADAHSILLDYGVLAPSEGMPRAMAAAETAVSLAPELGECQASLALAQQLAWKWKPAERSFKKALEFAPSYAVARQRFALHLAWMGRHDEALAQIQHAERLDPLSLAVQASVGWILYYGRDFDDSIRRLEAILRDEPEFPTALSALGLALSQNGDHQQAVDSHQKAVEYSGRSSASLALLGYTLGRVGDLDGADRASRELEGGVGHRYTSRYYAALPALGSGNLDLALDHLDAAVAEGSTNLVYARVEPILDPLREMPRFEALLREVGPFSP